MKKLLLATVVALALVSFTKVDNTKTILKDVDGTLLESYVVVDDKAKTITFKVDGTTSVSSAVINDELKIFLVENGSSNIVKEHVVKLEGNGKLSFDSYFESNFDVAQSSESSLAKAAVIERPAVIIKT